MIKKLNDDVDLIYKIISKKKKAYVYPKNNVRQ